jgi:hypothetical protein
MVRKPPDQRVVDGIPNSCHEQDAAGKSGIHPGDIGEEDELEKDNRAACHSRPQLACPIGQTLQVSELRGVSPHYCGSNSALIGERLPGWWQLARTRCGHGPSSILRNSACSVPDLQRLSALVCCGEVEKTFV